MNERINRSDKKRLRAILLCYTGNHECRKTKISKQLWTRLKLQYRKWLSLVSVNEYKAVNMIK